MHLCVTSRINIKIIPENDSEKMQERLDKFNDAFQGKVLRLMKR